MSTVAENINISPEEYLENEKTAEFKHEYLKGEILAMVGASDNHVTIAGNLFLLLKQQLKGSACRSYTSHGHGIGFLTAAICRRINSKKTR